MRCEGVVHHTQRQPRAPKRRRETFVPFLLGGVLCKQNSWTGNPGVKSQLLVVPPRTTTKLARRSSSSAARRVEISRLLASARTPHARGTRPVPSGRAPRLDRSPGRARLAAPPRLPSGRVVRATRCRSPPPPQQQRHDERRGGRRGLPRAPGPPGGQRGLGQAPRRDEALEGTPTTAETTRVPVSRRAGDRAAPSASSRRDATVRLF